VALKPLERLLAWSKTVEKTAYDSDGVLKIVTAYRTRLGLSNSKSSRRAR
jgi:hypothetical protein